MLPLVPPTGERGDGRGALARGGARDPAAARRGRPRVERGQRRFQSFVSCPQIRGVFVDVHLCVEVYCSKRQRALSMMCTYKGLYI